METVFHIEMRHRNQRSAQIARGLIIYGIHIGGNYNAVQYSPADNSEFPVIHRSTPAHELQRPCARFHQSAGPEASPTSLQPCPGSGHRCTAPLSATLRLPFCQLSLHCCSSITGSQSQRSKLRTVSLSTHLRPNSLSIAVVPLLCN